MGQGCAFKKFAFGKPWDPAFLECCHEVLLSTTELFSSPDSSSSFLGLTSQSTSVTPNELPGSTSSNTLPTPGKRKPEIYGMSVAELEMVDRVSFIFFRIGRHLHPDEGTAVYRYLHLNPWFLHLRMSRGVHPFGGWKNLQTRYPC